MMIQLMVVAHAYISVLVATATHIKPVLHEQLKVLV